MTDDEIFSLWTALQPHIPLIYTRGHSGPARLTSAWATTVLGRHVFKQEAHEISERLHQIYRTQQRLVGDGSEKLALVQELLNNAIDAMNDELEKAVFSVHP